MTNDNGFSKCITNKSLLGYFTCVTNECVLTSCNDINGEINGQG